MDELCYDVANKLKDRIQKRVHTEGKASDGSQIGEYSKGYMKVRTGNYPENAIKRGKNKGTFKEKKSQAKAEAGVFTKGKNKGQPRPVYNRENNRRVILSLSSHMEQDFAETQPVPVQNGYGIGFTEEFNYNKAIWNEERYGKKIWDLTNDEIQLAEDIVNEYIDEINH